MIPAFPRLPSVTQKYVCNEPYGYLMINISYMLMVRGVVVGWLTTSHGYVRIVDCTRVILYKLCIVIQCVVQNSLSMLMLNNFR